jgi:hypothetical protein
LNNKTIFLKPKARFGLVATSVSLRWVQIGTWQFSYVGRSIFWLYYRLIFAGLLFGFSYGAHAATTDCIGTSVDGKAQCQEPTYATPAFSVCDERGSYLYIQNAWAVCSTQLGTPSPIPTEAQVLALANCTDAKLAAGGGQMGPIAWDSSGVTYTSNLCSSGTSVQIGSHFPFRIGHTAGAFANYTYTQTEAAACPTGTTAVTKVLYGASRTVACRPNTCLADQEVNAIDGTCVDVVTRGRGQDGAGRMCMGNPIYPLNGGKREQIDTGFAVGKFPLVVTYETLPKLHGAPLWKMPSLGNLWNSNMHLNLAVSSSGKLVEAQRGDGSKRAFTGSISSGYVVERGFKDALSFVNGQYILVSGDSQNVEIYNSAGQLQFINFPDGGQAYLSYSTGASTVAPAGGLFDASIG